MTKENLQKELLEKVKPGTKPSDLKKLKRSKSADDIPSAPPLTNATSLNRSKSTEPSHSFTDPKYPYTTLISQQQELDQLKKESEAKSTTISLLRKKIGELEKSNLPNLLLQEQLAQKQQQIEELRAKLETKPLASELDQALLARHQNLKDWFTKYQQKKVLEQELAQNINEASTELITQGQTISTLRSENRKLKQTNQSLQKDLDLAQRAVQWRQTPLPNSPLPLPWIPYALSFCLVGAVLYLTIR